MVALGTQTLKSSHITPRNKLLNSYLGLLIVSLPVPRGTKKLLGQKIAISSSHAIPHYMDTRFWSPPLHSPMSSLANLTSLLATYSGSSPPSSMRASQ